VSQEQISRWSWQNAIRGENPIQLRRVIANCYVSTKPLTDAIKYELTPRLDREMEQDRYGEALQHVLVRISFSYFDPDHCKCNFIAFDEPQALQCTRGVLAILSPDAMALRNVLDELRLAVDQQKVRIPFRVDK